MVKLDLVRHKAGRLRATLGLLRQALHPPDELGQNRDLLDLVAFRVYLAMQEALDLASHVIADQGWGPGANLREQFELLAANGVMPADLAVSLSAGVRVRNLIGHGYAEIDVPKLHAAASALSNLGERFCASVLAWAEAQPVGPS